MRLELFVNPSRRDRVGFPLIVALQSKAAEGNSQIIAPLTFATSRSPNSRLLPRVEHDDQQYIVVFTLMTNLPTRVLRDPVGTVVQHRDDLTRALDWLFWGV